MAREHKNSLVKTPFTDDIYLVDRPKKFTMPSFTQFNGTRDPSRHLDHYAQKMALDDHDNPFMCKIFPTNLTGATLEWFGNRPHKSIPDYETLCTIFLAQYCRNKKQKKSITSLFTIRQKKRKTLQDFLSRFSMEASKIAHCHPATAIEMFKLAIIQGTKFHTSLVKYSPPDMQTLNARAQIYIRLEENVAQRVQHATLVIMENKPREKVSNPKSQKSQHASAPVTQVTEKGQRTKEKFTTLRSTLARLFQENKMKFTAPQPMKQPLEQKDKNKHCAYHRNYGHTTNDCRSHRRQVENMIIRGELADYLTTKEYMKPRGANPRRVEGNQVKLIHAIHGRSEDDQESEEVYRSRLRTAHKLRKLSSVNTVTSSSISIGFGDTDLSRVQLPHEDPLVISLLVANCMIKRVLIDPGSSANIITKVIFEQLEIPSSLIRSTSSPLMGFDGMRVDPLGVIDLSVTAAKRMLKENFILTEMHPSYKLIMGRGWIHQMNGVPSTFIKRCDACLRMSPLPKYLKASDEAEATKLTEKSLEAIEVILGDPQKVTYIGSSPTTEENEALIDVIRRNANAFAWEHSDMVGIDLSVSCHSLKVDPVFEPVKQRHRRFAPERNQIIAEEVNKLLQVGFIREVYYP
ncbi:uncharacterized protein LOC132309199 [Cornus florida]|uniref:uncharacterized protein LOC132309199 n=1 Tax=Cornus florida TaxID=4283 RepID=UPI002898E734|nr:uncharacterized protein LOC132309199 [Cornus florida]